MSEHKELTEAEEFALIEKDPIAALCHFVKQAGGTMRLYGVPVTEKELRTQALASATERIKRVICSSIEGQVMAKRKKYPTLFGTYMDTGYKREYTAEYLQATIDLSHYKGHIMLRVLPEKPKKGTKHTCSCPSIQYPVAWMDGDDLDALIEILKDAKKQWLMAYRVAQYEETKQKRTAQRAKERKRRAR